MVDTWKTLELNIKKEDPPNKDMTSGNISSQWTWYLACAE